MNTVILDKPKETPYIPKPITKTDGGFGNKKPPKLPTKIGYARNPDDKPNRDTTDSDAWGLLGLEDPFK